MEQDTSKFNNTDHLDLNVDIHSQNFNVIRLASYRTAVKFRFIQRRTHRNSQNYTSNLHYSRKLGNAPLETHLKLELSFPKFS